LRENDLRVKWGGIEVFVSRGNKNGEEIALVDVYNGTES